MTEAWQLCLLQSWFSRQNWENALSRHHWAFLLFLFFHISCSQPFFWHRILHTVLKQGKLVAPGYQHFPQPPWMPIARDLGTILIAIKKKKYDMISKGYISKVDEPMPSITKQRNNNVPASDRRTQVQPAGTSPLQRLPELQQKPVLPSHTVLLPSKPKFCRVVPATCFHKYLQLHHLLPWIYGEVA